MSPLEDTVRTVLAHPVAGPPARVGYAAAADAQLALAKGMDRRRFGLPSPQERARVADQVTMTVKTFLRPAVCRRLVRSARTVFDGRIVVADDSPQPLSVRDANIEVLPLPFNSGVSHGRNAALDAVRTPYTLVTDDDLVLTAGARIGRALAYLERNPEVDICGFVRIELPRRYYLTHDAGVLFPGALPPLRPHGELIDGLPVQVKIEQIYLARTESLQQVRWDENIRMVDHNDFFSAASGRLVTVLDHQSVAYHARTPFDATYTSYRDDVAADLSYLARKWGTAGGGAARQDRKTDSS